MLLAHYTVQWRDRMTYWMARQRSRSIKDIVTLIIDSYDKGKICLPKFPQARTPKAVVYETVRRSLANNVLWYVASQPFGSLNNLQLNYIVQGISEQLWPCALLRHNVDADSLHLPWLWGLHVPVWGGHGHWCQLDSWPGNLVST